MNHLPRLSKLSDDGSASAWRAVLCMLLLSLELGCRPEPIADLPDESRRPSGSSTRDATKLVTPERTSFVRDPTPSPTAGDPSVDDWETEAFSERATKQLKEFGHLLEQRVSPGDPSFSAVLDASFQSSALLPESMKTVYQDTRTQVDRWFATDQDGAKQDDTGANALTNRTLILEPLLESFADCASLKSKFKLFRVEMSSTDVTTRQYVHLSGRSSQQLHEYNATWVIGWSVGHDDDPPHIRWIRVEQVERTTSHVAGHPWLVDCTESLMGTEYSYQTALRVGIDHWLTRLESSLGVYNFGHHGITVGDVNGDGLDDLYVCQTGGIPNHLFIQRSDGTLRDASTSAQVDYLDNTRSALLIDLDNDGDQDLVLALASGLLFLENDGHAQFHQRARISSVRQAFSLAAADYDSDGRLDLYVCVYYDGGDRISELPLPLPYFDAQNGGRNFLIRNRGEWKFEDVTAQSGLDDDNRRYSFAAAWEDYDNDGDLDLLVVNDFGPNHLYINQAGRFHNVADQIGLLDGAFGMSASWADYDHDGYYDIYVANMFSAAGNRVAFQPRFKSHQTDQTRSRFRHLARGNSLFRNRGDGTYEDVSVEMGVTMGRWSWASLFADLNNDRWEDLLVTNGYVTGTQTDDL